MSRLHTRFALSGIFVFGVVSLLAMSGCGVVPAKVTYREVTADVDSPFGFPFRPRRSMLLVSFENTDKKFTVESAPTELDPEGNWTGLLQVGGVDDWKSTTQLKMTYVPETKLIDEIKVTTTDNIADTITKVGNVIAAVAPVAAGVVASTANASQIAFQPTTFDPTWAGSGWRQDQINRNYCMRLSGLSIEQGLTLKQYLGSRKRAARDFPVASCATGVLEIAECPGGPAGFSPANPDRVRVNFAASDQVTPIPLPSSGAVKMSAICGAVVTEADKQDRRELVNYLTSLMEAVKKIEEAKKKK
jgi:hypothetical protein